MIYNEVAKALNSEQTTVLFKDLYGTEQIEDQKKRYDMVAKGYHDNFKGGDFEFFTSPGRTEIGGNHTDHNHGKVLAGSINLDCVAAAGLNHSDSVCIISETYNQHLVISLNDLEPSGKNTGTLPLVKGILAGFLKRGYKIGGFNAYITSNVISAAGVSSSASFEMLLCSMINYFFNEGSVSTVDYAHIGKFAENCYWDKQSGLLDQMACAVGGIITIDFKNAEDPKVEQIPFDLQSMDYNLVIVNTGKGHADLSQEYSSIPIEMKKVAGFFGKEVLAEITEEDVLENLPAIRQAAGDRGIMRAFHFFEENKKVEKEVEALKNNQIDEFLELITASGNSSWKWLQNCYAIDNYDEQSITVALACTELFLAKIKKGACRVHGGGFAGVIMAFIPKESTKEYIEYIETMLGGPCSYVMNIRKYGAIHVTC